MVTLFKSLLLAVACLVAAGVIILLVYIVALFGVSAWQKLKEEVQKNGRN